MRDSFRRLLAMRLMTLAATSVVLSAAAAGVAFAEPPGYYTFSYSYTDPPHAYDAVPLPADPHSAEQAQLYTDALIDAIDHSCRRANNPPVEVDLYRFRECVAVETQRVAAEEPTGLLADRLGESRATAEARY